MERHHESFDQNDLLEKIIDGTAAETGSGFFRSLVKNLSQSLGTNGAWVTEYLPDENRLRALAFWLAGEFVDHYEYDIRGTPCEASIINKTYLHIPENVVDLFPGDPDLPKIRAVSYMGFPLVDTENRILGNLAVVDTRKMPESFRHLAVFRIFTARATAELLRLRAEKELRAREEKLRELFAGAMDAIVELDHEFNILLLNPAAEHILGCSQERCIGSSFKRFLDPIDVDRLRQAIRQQYARPKGERRGWVRDGLAVLNADRESVPTEATLSLIEADGSLCSLLILRDVRERYEAQKTIMSLRDETEYLRDEIQSLYNLGEIIGESPSFRKSLQLVAEVSATDATVLINGETGTGKELIARAIHAASLRKDRPLITVNCAAVPDTLMESEFFGHEKGAFTGAAQRREGRFAIADGGTIFLDEVGELNRELQAKLLRVLQEGEFTPVGASRPRRTNVRVIAATNRILSREVRDGRFRPDLFYRLNVFPITVPPLRERGDDIRLLVEHFVVKTAKRMGRQILPPGVDCIERLKAYDWPGNVRELQNVIERGVITARQGRLNLDHALPIESNAPETEVLSSPLETATGIRTAHDLQQLERLNTLLALESCQWRVAGEKGAAKLLGVPPSTLQSRMKALKIKRPQKHTIASGN
ncbi:MAG: sigma 54-interacting transcriptional regulator [Desulfobacterales bacterium]|jgi:PAS domain S-box-containing protein